jgi:hypothetical protein
MSEGNGKQDSFNDWATQFAPKRVEAHVCSDESLVAKLEAAEKELSSEHKDGMLGGLQAELTKQVEALRAEIQKKSMRFVFQSIGRKRWSDLLAEHPPTEEDKARNTFVDNHLETFAPAALHACCVEPSLTKEQAQMLWDQFNLGQATKLFVACMDANMDADEIPLDVIGRPLVGAKRSKPRSS